MSIASSRVRVSCIVHCPYLHLIRSPFSPVCKISTPYLFLFVLRYVLSYAISCHAPACFERAQAAMSSFDPSLLDCQDAFFVQTETVITCGDQCCENTRQAVGLHPLLWVINQSSSYFLAISCWTIEGYALAKPV